jgi:carboxyl-terminal processing protease
MSKGFKISLIVIISIMVLSMAFGAGCIYNLNLSSTSRGPDTNLIHQAWDVVTRNYVEPSKVDTTTLNEGAIRGMVQSLKDPYSVYLAPDDYSLQQSNMKGSFYGIGAQVSTNAEKQIIIVAPVENSPAARAGIKTGDIILAVDGQSTKDMGLTQAVLLVRGPEGTTVKLKILHSGETAPVDIEVIRAKIDAPSVTSSMKGNVAYIKIYTFDESTNDKMEAALQSLDLKNAVGIILDLRDNPGGLVSAVVNVASHFIKEGVIITLRDNQGKTTSQSVNPNGTFTELPMVVLVNQYSASGSEVLSGALQDYQRATIAGVKTLGKGSYDAFFKLNDDSAIYLTIGRWLTPHGREIEGEGITPDVVLTQTGDSEIQWAIDYLNNQ